MTARSSWNQRNARGHRPRLQRFGCASRVFKKETRFVVQSRVTGRRGLAHKIEFETSDEGLKYRKSFDPHPALRATLSQWERDLHEFEGKRKHLSLWERSARNARRVRVEVVTNPALSGCPPLDLRQ